MERENAYSDLGTSFACLETTLIVEDSERRQI